MTGRRVIPPAGSVLFIFEYLQGETALYNYHSYSYPEVIAFQNTDEGMI
jgi:hypothetical protein